MNVRNCRKCGRIFNYVTGPHICPACREKQEQDFQRVKEYIRENKGATVTQVSEECEVDVAQIHQWLREERLELSEGSGIVLQCESCGAPISSGRYCDKCRHDLSKGLSDSVKPIKAAAPVQDSAKKDSDRMRFLNK
jgi:flagellar operon protein (TIGR03826 family)